MEKPFQKDLSHLSWDQVYERQAMRADLVSDWIEGLRLKSGDRVLEIGAGPGYVSFVLAERVGHRGTVYALDRSAEALAYLERLQTERGIGQIQPDCRRRGRTGAHRRAGGLGPGYDGPASRR